MTIRPRFLALLCLLTVSTACRAQPAPTALLELDTFPRSTLTISSASGVQRFDIWIADTPQRETQGLMFVRDLPASQGMLFVNTPPRPMSMWMKNTYIPLDMVFIRADGIVHRIEARTEPLSETVVSSGGPMAAVLELAGGAAERLGLKPGDKVIYPLIIKK